MAKIGLYRSPEAFVEVAKELEHPFHSRATLAGDLKASIFSFLTDGPEKIMERREKNFAYYELRKRQLEDRE